MMFEESRKGLEESYATLAKLIERNHANRWASMDGMSEIVMNVKLLQRWCENCTCSVDCQCNPCVYGCVCSVDCQCYFCLDDFSREKNEGDNQAEVVLDDHAIAELLKVENGSEINSEYNEYQVFDECPQRIESEILVELPSIQNTNTIESVPLSILVKVLSFLFKGKRHKLDTKFGDKLFDINLERDILAAFCGPHTTIDLLPHAFGLYVCNWVDIGQVF